MTSRIRASRRIHLSVPHMSGNELAHVRKAFDSNWLSTVGPNLSELEKSFSAYTGLACVALSSGTAGIHLAVKLLGVGHGDEVVTPTLTFAASCNPILYQGGIPIFIDSDRASWNLDRDRLADFLSGRARTGRLPKAVAVVHLYGQTADLDSILDVCARYGLPVLEDAAECLGAQYKGRIPGAVGDVGVYSFNGNKIITGTSGGILVSARKEWVDRARFWSTQARDGDPLGVNNYVHSELGYNYRMSNVLAGIALGQLEVLDLRVQQRRAVFDRYRAAFADLPGIEPQPEAEFGDRRSEIGDGWEGQGAGGGVGCEEWGVRGEGQVAKGEGTRTFNVQRSTLNVQPSAINHQPSTSMPLALGSLPPGGSLHTRWLSCFLIDERKFGMSSSDLIRFLDAANVESRPVWKPMHTQPLYRGFECVGGEVAEDLNRRGICLPSSSSLSEEEQQFVIERVREAHREGKG